jgi:excisionase family DNA binding protein
VTEITTASSATVVLKLDSAGRALLSVAQARTALSGISTSSLYKLVNEGDLRAVRIGARTMFKVEDVNALIDRGTNLPPRTCPWDKAGQMAR